MYPESHWNYRLATKVTYVEAMNKSYRTFQLIECHYTKGVAHMYGEKGNSLSGHETINELKGSHALMEGAFDKPILDLDNFPNEYEPKPEDIDYVDDSMENE